jgi:hypothetical protein|nr:hypothetical protein [Kofleriaceae bacterium]
MVRCAVVLIAVLAGGVARGDTNLPDDAGGGAVGPGPGSGSGSGVTPHEPPRTPDATTRQVFAGPFTSSRLFAMPVADTVGPYMLSLSGDGSLLQQPGVLTSDSVLAIGFGDLAQLEYRHSSAISVTNVDAPVPAVGVQLKLPIPDHLNVPAIGLAFRLGVPRDESFEGATVTETVTDLYAVARLRTSIAPWLTLHGGVRASSATLQITGEPTRTRTLWLPTGGYEIQMNPTAKIVGEIALAPQFTAGATPTIGYGVLGRFGLRWSLLPAVTLDASIGYQLDTVNASPGDDFRDVVQQWDIRLGAEVFVPWGALACRATGVFCN